MTTTRRRPSPPKFIQVQDGKKTLIALDEHGDIWTYQGRRWGWRKTNMHRMTIDEINEMKDTFTGGGMDA